MTKTLNEILLDWIGGDVETNISSTMDLFGYNEALSDLRARVPELEKLVIEHIKESIMAHGFNFFSAKTALVSGNVIMSRVPGEKLCIDCDELIEYLNSLTKK